MEFLSPTSEFPRGGVTEAAHLNTATVRAVGSTDTQNGAPCPITKCQQSHLRAHGPNCSDLAAVLLEAERTGLASGWVPGASKVYQIIDESRGGQHTSRLHAVRAHDSLNDNSIHDSLNSSAMKDSVPTAALLVAVQPISDLPSDHQGRNASDAKGSSTQPGWETAGPAAAVPAAAAGPMPSCHAFDAVCVDPAAPQVRPTQLQHLTQQQQQQQWQTPQDSSAGCEGNDGKSSSTYLTTLPPPAAAVLHRDAAVTIGQRRARQPCTRELLDPGADRYESQHQQKLVKASNPGGGGGGGGDGVDSRQCSRNAWNEKEIRRNLDMSDDDEESGSRMNREGSGEPLLESSRDRELEEEEDGEQHGMQGQERGDDVDHGDGQPEEHMPGCPRCRFAQAGCRPCRAKPLASRPYARWKPDEARFQEDIPDAPIFYPTPEEFEDPLTYISTIRPKAEKYGICRVVPPVPYWDPPFALDSGGGREVFRFETQRQIISHLCMRPGGDVVRQGKGRGQEGLHQQQQEQPGIVRQEAVANSGRVNQMWIASLEELSRARLQPVGGRSHQESAHQHQHEHRIPRFHQYWQQAQPHNQPEQIEEQSHQQKQNDQAAAAAPVIGAFLLTNQGGVEPCSARRAQGSPAIPYPPQSILRMVAPGSGPRPRAPPAVVDESLQRYITGLQPHPLLGLDTAAANEAMAAIAAAAEGTGAVAAHCARTSPTSSQGTSDSAVSSKMASLSRQRPSNGRLVQAAPAAPAVSSGRSGRSDQKGGSDSGSDSGSELGFVTSERTYTLRSFQAYCNWARSVHFGLPPYGARFRDKSAAERGSCNPPESPGMITTSHSKTTDAPYAMDTPVAPAAELSPRVMAAIAHAAAGCEPSVEEVEAEFWRIVERPMGDLVMETLYGGSLDSELHGSAFPLPPWRAPPSDMQGPVTSAGTSIQDERTLHYSSHPWNIHNLSRATGSVLRYQQMNEAIAGGMVPTLDIGSCLSAFCWHLEDHAFYSINYLHMGAPKVWYGVPACAADQFEAAMRDAVPHLFHEDPLLLHRRVTHMSPTELRRRGIPVCRLVQEAGSFVITFPNAYHAGLNCGFNCSEAINFAPADWLPFGSAAVRKYRTQCKRNTISHDSLLVRLVSAARAVVIARHTAALPHLLRPKIAAEEELETEPGVVKEDCLASIVVKPEPAAIAAFDKALVAEAANGNNGGGGGGGDVDSHSPYSCQAGVRLEEVSIEAVSTAVGELTLRLEEEQRRRAMAREFGVTQESPMSDLTCVKVKTSASGTCTIDTDCVQCKCDLFLSAVVSPQRPGVVTCPEHAASLGAPPSACILMVRHSLDELQSMIDAALDLLPEANAAIRTARLHMDASPVKSIRRLGPISKYGMPFASPMGDQDARDAASEIVSAIAGPLANEPYVPYDPEAAICCDGDGGEVHTDKSGAVTVVMPAADDPETDKDELALWESAPKRDADTEEPASPPLMATVAVIAGSEQERRSQEKAKMLEGHPAEAQGREEQHRIQDRLQPVRVQQTSRRGTAAAGDAQEHARPISTLTSEAAQLAPACLAMPTSRTVLCSLALADITPTPSVPSPLPVLVLGEAPGSELINRPVPVHPISATGADPIPATAVQVHRAQLGTDFPQSVMLVQGSDAQGAGTPEQVPLSQGTKRNNRSGTGASVIIETDRVTRPRRERRVPKHLLDSEMELAQEMQQVVEGATAAAAAAAAAAMAIVEAPQASSPSPASPATASPGAAAKATAPKPHVQMPPASSTSSSSRQDKDPVQQVPLAHQSSPKVGSSEVDSLALPGVQLNTAVLAVNLVAAMLGAVTHGAGKGAELLMMPMKAIPALQQQQQQEQAQQQQQQQETPEPTKLPQSQQHPAQRTLTEPPQQGQGTQGTAAPCLQQQQQQKPQDKPHEAWHEVQQQQEQNPLNQTPPLQLKLQPKEMAQWTVAPQPQATAEAPEREPSSAIVPALAPLPVQVDEFGISPRRSSRPTRPSVRLLSVSGSGGGGGVGAGGGGNGPATGPVTAAVTASTPATESAATAGAATAAPSSRSAPGVFLLRRETTSGPSTSIRSGQMTARRLSSGVGAAASGSLPPTSAPGAAATVTNVPAAARAPRSIAAGPSTLPTTSTTAKAASAKASSASRTGAIAPGVGELSDQDRLRRQPRATEDLGPKFANALSGKEVQLSQPSQQKEPEGLALVPRPALTPLQRSGSYNAGDLSGSKSSSFFAASTVPEDVFGSLHSGLPDVSIMLQPSDLAPSGTRAAALPPQHSHTPLETSVGLDAALPQPEPSTALQLQLPPTAPPASVSAAQQKPTGVQSVTGRPVRKRKTTLTHDMVIYGESAALFGQGSAKRKSNGDRRAAASTTSGSGSGSGAGASVGVGTGSSIVDAPQTGDDNEVAAMAELEDTNDSLATFSVEELRPLAVSMSPLHPLFSELHRESTPSSPPIALSMPLAACMNLHHILSEPADTVAGGIELVRGGLGDAHTGNFIRAQADMDMEETAGAVALPSTPVFLGLHDDDDGDRGDEHDQDMFIVEAPRSTLALSASPSVNGLDSLAAMMLEPPPCGGSPRMAAGYGVFVHVAEAAKEASDADANTHAGAGATAAAISASVRADGLMGSQQLQLLVDSTVAPCAVTFIGAPCPGVQLRLHASMLSEQRVSGGGISNGMYRDEAADQHAGSLSGQGLGVLGFSTAAAGGSASTLLPTGLVLAELILPQTEGEVGEPFMCDGPASVASYMEGSRQGLSGLAASAAGDWADLDDIVVL